MDKALVWFKRDLRTRDHAALAAAGHARQAAALFIFEPAWLNSPECDAQHLAFTRACLAELRTALAARGLPLLVAVGEAVEVLASLRQQWAYTDLVSHEETGTGWSYTRDIAVGRWCGTEGVRWLEAPQTGVVRRLRSRLGWAGRWQQRMEADEAPLPARFQAAPLPARFEPATGLHEAPLPTLAQLGFLQHRTLPPAGEAAAWATLGSFLQGRGRGYRQHLSSPLTAEQGCSRLSAHLAFGSLSMRCVHQATEAAIQVHRDHLGDARLAHDLRGFASRLRWHCHFMQKLEDEPAIEHRNFARVFDGLRDEALAGAEDQARFQAWCEGRTGFPMVDACMRSLVATGWLNFRMRAMLVSFAAYHLGLHWRAPGLFLARQFLDFEPGIHWSQLQMQSGTTGINTLRIYSPRKQAADHDPAGLFQRRWLPELGTAAYPAPIVDEKPALKAIKDRLYALRATPEARAQANAVQQQHGSRKAGLPSTTGRARRSVKVANAASGGTADAASAQQELF